MIGSERRTNDAGTGRDPVVELSGVSLLRDGRRLLDSVDWTVQPGQHWVVLGRNGSGKTSLVRVVSMYEHPSRGSVRVCGGELGRSDVRSLRRRIALVSPALADQIRPGLSAREVVMCARHAALEPWWHHYDDDDRDQAGELLGRLGCAALTERTFGTLSSGERQRVLLARALMTEPELLLLDEPTAGLDLTATEELVDYLGALARDPAAPPIVLVTHHVDEIPAGFTHLLALHRGRVLARGPLSEVLTGPLLSRCFDLPLQVAQRGDRWTAWRAPS